MGACHGQKSIPHPCSSDLHDPETLRSLDVSKRRIWTCKFESGDREAAWWSCAEETNGLQQLRSKGFVGIAERCRVGRQRCKLGRECSKVHLYCHTWSKLGSCHGHCGDEHDPKRRLVGDITVVWYVCASETESHRYGRVDEFLHTRAIDAQREKRTIASRICGKESCSLGFQCTNLHRKK